MKTNFKPRLQETVTNIAWLCSNIEKAMYPNIVCLFSFM